MRTLKLVGLAALFLAGACAPIEDPWVQSPEQLTSERARDDAAQKALRDRMATTQIDR